jgi:hypothetical protein
LLLLELLPLVRSRWRRRALLLSLLLLRLTPVCLGLSSLGVARDPDHGFTFAAAPLAALVEGERGYAGAVALVRGCGHRPGVLTEMETMPRVGN